MNSKQRAVDALTNANYLAGGVADILAALELAAEHMEVEPRALNVLARTLGDACDELGEVSGYLNGEDAGGGSDGHEPGRL